MHDSFDKQEQVQETHPPNPGTSLTKKAGILAFSRALTIFTQIASIMVLTRVLPKETFGILSFLLQTYTIIVTLCHLGLPESIFYFFERVPKESRKSLALLTGRNLFLIGIAGSAILVLINFVAPLWGFQVRGLVLPFIFLVLIELPTLPLANILISIDKVKQAGFLSIVIGALQFAALILPAMLNYSLKVIVYCLLLYGICRFLLSAILFFRNFKGVGGALPKGLTREQFRYSIPVGISQILWGLNRQIDKYIVAAFLPVTVYAEYVIGSWEIPFIPAIAYSVSAVIMPKLVSYGIKNDNKALLELWFKAIKKVSVIVLPLAVLFLLIAEEFIVTFFTEDYIGASLPFRIYTVIIFQRVAAYSSMFKALGETKIIYYSAVYLVLINFVLSIPLVLLLGMAGPPLATLIANFFTWGYALTKMKKSLGVALIDVFPFKFYLRTLCAAFVAAIPVFTLKLILDFNHQAMLGIMMVAYLICYCFMAVLFGVVTKADWKGLLKAKGLS